MQITEIMSHYWINDGNQQNNWYNSEVSASWGQYNNRQQQQQQQSAIPQSKILHHL